MSEAQDVEKQEVVEAEAAQPEQVGPQQGKLKTFFASLSDREKNIGMVALLILSVVILDLVTIRPLANSLEKGKETILEKKKMIPMRLMIFQHRDRILKDHDAFKGYITKKDLSAEEEIAQLLREIERVSQQAGIFISNIHPVESKVIGEEAYQLSVNVEGAGVIANLKRFIVELEKSNPAFQVQAMNLRSQGPETNEIRYKFSVLKLGLKEVV